MQTCKLIYPLYLFNILLKKIEIYIYIFYFLLFSLHSKKVNHY